MVLCARFRQGADHGAPAVPPDRQLCRPVGAERIAGRGRDGPLVNVASSRFLRPFNRRLAPLDRLRARRIEKAMQEAAVTGGTFHLWWHPENFGKNLTENMTILTKVLDWFERLRDGYGMHSRAMHEVGQRAPVGQASYAA